jgi:hypothetical protein
MRSCTCLATTEKYDRISDSAYGNTRIAMKKKEPGKKDPDKGLHHATRAHVVIHTYE